MQAACVAASQSCEVGNTTVLIAGLAEPRPTGDAREPRAETRDVRRRERDPTPPRRGGPGRGIGHGPGRGGLVESVVSSTGQAQRETREGREIDETREFRSRPVPRRCRSSVHPESGVRFGVPPPRRRPCTSYDDQRSD
jgi:hypothetical protein